MNKMNQLAAELKTLKDEKERLEEKTKEIGAALSETEQALFDLMSEEGNDSFELEGYKFSRQVRPCYSVLAQLREELINRLKLFGIDRDDIVTETIPAPKLNSVMKGICEENGGSLPEEFDGIVSLYEKKSIGVRRTGKGRL